MGVLAGVDATPETGMWVGIVGGTGSDVSGSASATTSTSRAKEFANYILCEHRVLTDRNPIKDLALYSILIRNLIRCPPAQCYDNVNARVHLEFDHHPRTLDNGHGGTSTPESMSEWETEFLTRPLTTMACGDSSPQAATSRTSTERSKPA